MKREMDTTWEDTLRMEENLENTNLFNEHPAIGADQVEDAPAATRRKTKPKTKADKFDQYYTRPEVAALCMAYMRNHIPEDEIATWLEPSAGTGAFLTLLPKGRRRGFDIDEEHKHEEVTKQNFLEWIEARSLARPVVTIGNPPFGKNASTALRFVNHAAGFSEWICMILPRTFDKNAMQNKVSLHHHLVRSYPLDPFSFEYEGQPYDVPCCFQVWRRMPDGEKRTPHRPFMEHPDFVFVSNHEDADFAFQRVGVNAGRASKEGLGKSWKSNHFIKVRDGLDPETVMDLLNGIDWDDVRHHTAGNPSIGKGEMIEAYSKMSPPAPNSPGCLDLHD